MVAKGICDAWTVDSGFSGNAGRVNKSLVASVKALRVVLSSWTEPSGRRLE